jgi:uncharacterized protein (DUF697 family)
MDLDATVRAHLEAAAAGQDVAVEDKKAKAEKIIWAAVALSAGMGAVPFGINFGFFIAVSGGLVVCLGEMYGYIYTKSEAAELVVQLFKGCGLTWTATAFGLKFMAEVLKVSGLVTMGVATPAGMALDAVLCGAVTYAVGFTTLRYLEQNRELPAEVLRTEFRTRFTEGMAILREQARQRSAELSTELGTEVRARYDTAAHQLKESADVLREQARQRGAELGTEVRARYSTAARQLRKKS